MSDVLTPGTDWHKSGIFTCKQTLVRTHHGVHHTGRNRGVIVSHCTRDMYWRGRSVKLNKILRVHKLWPLRTTHHLNPYLPGRDFH